MPHALLTVLSFGSQEIYRQNQSALGFSTPDDIDVAFLLIVFGSV